MGAIKLLSVDDSGVQLEDGINVIERLTGALRIIVMIGDGRAGKSFLANKIVGEEVNRKYLCIMWGIGGENALNTRYSWEI